MLVRGCADACVPVYVYVYVYVFARACVRARLCVSVREREGGYFFVGEIERVFVMRPQIDPNFLRANA